MEEQGVCRFSAAPALHRWAHLYNVNCFSPTRRYAMSYSCLIRREAVHSRCLREIAVRTPHHPHPPSSVGAPVCLLPLFLAPLGRFEMANIEIREATTLKDVDEVRGRFNLRCVGDNPAKPANHRLPDRTIGRACPSWL